jgi:hypothetical protein
MRGPIQALFLTAASLLPATAALAAGPQAGIDPNTFIVGHPASPSWKRVHANQEHPAVLVARRAQQQADAHVSQLDANLFIVQPPASVRWLAAAPAPVQLAAVQH